MAGNEARLARKRVLTLGKHLGFRLNICLNAFMVIQSLKVVSMRSVSNVAPSRGLFLLLP